jgi:hypothetical protein
MPMHTLLPVALACLALLVARPAAAEEVTLAFTGTVTSSSGDLSGVISVSDPISGTFTYESTTPGVFTPGDVFFPATMQYAGTVTAVAVTVVGDTVSGSSGDIVLTDGTGVELFGGDDGYSVTAIPDTGTIAGVAIAGFSFASVYRTPPWR